MNEKIKIYVPETVYRILLKDIELFEIFKKDGSLNKNSFYNTLICNYHETYQERIDRYHEFVEKVIYDYTGNSYKIDEGASKIVTFIEENSFENDDQPMNVTVSLKPTKQSEDIIRYIGDNCLRNMTLSAYFRNMFTAYTQLPQDRRERIIFKRNFELIEEAIADRRMIYFTTSKNANVHTVSPYSLCRSKEELFNYLLCEDTPYPYSFRISRIRKIVLTNKKSSFLECNVDIFRKMEIYGPQFSYNVDHDNKQIVVVLNEEGKKLYRRLYVHRPQYTAIDGDRYYFECSQFQASNYFSRFGANARIEEPEELAEKMYEFHRSAAEAYKKSS